MVPPSRGLSEPEQKARVKIDEALELAGWLVQNWDEANLHAGRGVAIREFRLKKGHGKADYLLFVDGEAVGVLEAKPEGHTLIGVEPQAKKYATGLPDHLTPPVHPLPFLYLSTGTVTRFTNLLDPEPRSRSIFHIHTPETLAEWLQANPLHLWTQDWHPSGTPVPVDSKPSSLRSRLRAMPPLDTGGLWPNQIEAITNLEVSLAADRPRALLQMATGSGKSLTAVTALHRLIKFGGARRVLFLVDRSNLGKQAYKEFSNFVPPDTNRKFVELFNVQHLKSNKVSSSSKVVITTIQRLYSMLKGEPELDPDVEEGSQFDTSGELVNEPLPVTYTGALPPEYFDVIVVDECHRSIYSLWRQVLEYFDAYLIGLTATPAKHTFGFFNRNLVMEYTHEQAVAAGVNVDFEVYEIRTQITASGSTIKAGQQDLVVGMRDRQTRKVRWETPDEDITYDAKALDRQVVAKDQIRLIVRTFKEKLHTEIFPGRKEVPKTLIFAKDDSHAEDIVGIVREEFGRGNDFCTKITYKVTGKKTDDLIQDFRTGFDPRIAVTVDMIATGTDIKPVEIVVFMRSVKSRVLFEQMKGRGVRIIDKNDLKAVTPDASAKTHFVIIDCVGVASTKKADTRPLERKKSISFKALFEHIAFGGRDPDMISSLASRLSRLDKRLDDENREKIKEASGDLSIKDIAQGIVDALSPDRQDEKAREQFDIPEEQEPTDEQIEKVAKEMLDEAVKPLTSKPKLRRLLQDLKTRSEQILDEISRDKLLHAGHSEDATEKARTMVTSFREFLEENKEEIDALHFFYSVPHGAGLRLKEIKALAEAIKAPPRSWTPERLWAAYEMLEKDKVRGASGERLLTDMVALGRFALEQDAELYPFKDHVHMRFDNWMAGQANQGKQFDEQQLHWLEMMRDHIATSLTVEFEDFGLSPFDREGGIDAALEVFGPELKELMDELNKVLAA